MAQYMIDTSALVKYYHPEVGSAQVIAIADDPSNVLFISRIGLVEIHSALARKVRTGELQVAALQQAPNKSSLSSKMKYLTTDRIVP